VLSLNGWRESVVSYSLRISGDSLNVELYLLRLTECACGSFKV
jgi:hypothetical protein